MIIVRVVPALQISIELMRDARLIFLRNGAYRWHLYEDMKQPNKFRMEIVVPSCKQHLLQSERMTKNEKDVLLKLRSLRTDPNPPAAAIAGILFSVLLITGLLLFRLSVQADPLEAVAWLKTSSTRVILAPNLLPFAGL